MDPVSAALGGVLRRNADRRDGRVADYIPELSRADPDEFGIALVSVLGRVYSAGDANRRFTIQSISKPFVYAVALSELGLDDVARHVGFEPSGEPFNAISLDASTGRPANPLINAGAIVASSLIPGSSPEARFDRILEALSGFAGRNLAVDEAVFRSESVTGNRNRALAYLASSSGVLNGSAEDAVQVYFRQCSVLVTTEDVAVMAATLANGGVNPVTDQRVIDEEVARSTMSVMATCGMYDDSGEWMVRVGLPAKSGVGGGIAAVRPSEFGIGVYSPRLDVRGNSTRGIAVLEDLSSAFGLHLLAHPSEPRSPIFVSGRQADERVVELRGEIDFIAAEQVVHHIRELANDLPPDGGVVRIDLTSVTRVRSGAEQILAAVVAEFAREGIDLVVIDPAGMASGGGSNVSG